jgi:hypothetical protein
MTTVLTTVLYGGPFQGRRVRFLVDSLAAARPSMDFVWLNPESGSEHAMPGSTGCDTQGSGVSMIIRVARRAHPPSAPGPRVDGRGAARRTWTNGQSPDPPDDHVRSVRLQDGAFPADPYT